MDIKQYLEQVEPINILGFIDISIINNLLYGVSQTFGTKFIIISPKKSSISSNILAKTNPNIFSNSLDSFHLCEYWCNPNAGCNTEQCSIDIDNHFVLKHLSYSGVKLYQCNPLSLWNMIFPIHIKSQVVGFLYEGQIALSDVFINCKDELHDYINLDTCPIQDNQIQAIKDKFESYKTSQKNKDELNYTLNNEYNSISIEDFKKRIKKFNELGENIQKLLNELYNHKKIAAEQSLLHCFEEQLSSINLEDSERWWEECGKVLYSLNKLPEVENVCLYTRNKSHYILKIPWSNNTLIPKWLSTREILTTFQPEQLNTISDLSNNEFNMFHNSGQNRIFEYHSQIKTGRDISTLIVFQGTNIEKREFLIELFRIICTATDFAQLIFQNRSNEEKYRLEVNLLGHSFRTPLQSLQFELEDLGKVPAILSSPELKAKVNNCLIRIKDATEDLLQLLTPSNNKDTFNIIEILNYVLRNMEPIAKNHPCTIIKQGEWKDSIIVKGDRFKVQRGITCLIDNAIKYSFNETQRNSDELCKVFVRVVVEDSFIKIFIINYGIGISESKLKAIREYGNKMGRNTLIGTGLGLPFAIDVFEDLGGWVYITSIPAKEATGEEIQKHYNYITNVEAALPILRGK